MTNSEIITSFYTAFANGNAQGMVDHYHDEILFYDPAFGELRGERAKAMWKMLISRGKGNIEIHLGDIVENEGKVSTTWIARYPYGRKKRQIINHINAEFEIHDGKIVRHMDTFDIWKWARQALGLPGILLGWSPFLKNKIRSQANNSLDSFMG